MPSPTEPSARSRSRDLRNRTAAGWYFVAMGLIGCGLAIALTGYFQMADSVRGLQRSTMPGTTEVALAAGRTTIYVETRVDGIEQRSENLDCRFLDGSGKPLELRPAKHDVSYSFGGYAGKKAWDVDIMAPGTFTIECSGKGAIAVGGGIGAWIIVALVGGLLPTLGGLGIAIPVFFKRRRQIRAGL
jgi:hypothetical protein